MIRKATSADLSAVAEIYRLILEQEKDHLVHTGWLPGVYPVAATAQAALERDALFVYDQSGAVLAAAIIDQRQVDAYAQGDWLFPCEEERVMVLHTLVVHPDAGRQGIGRAFVLAYEAYAAEHRCTVLRMDTNAINTAARTLYHGLGYREAGIVPCTFNGIPNVQLVLLEKRVGQ